MESRSVAFGVARALLLVGLLVPGLAKAITCNFTNGSSVATTTLPLPTTLTVLRDAPVGTVLYRSPNSAKPVVYARCSNLNPGNPVVVVGWQSNSSISNGIFSTNLKGIGIKFYSVEPASSLPGFPVWCSNCTQSRDWGMAVRYEIVKTGPVTGGTLSDSREWMYADLGGEYGGEGSFKTQTLRLTGTLNVVAPTCRTPDVAVALGDHYSYRIGGVGSGTPWRAFDIKLQNCPVFPAGAKLRFMVSPTTAILDAAKGVAALREGSPQAPAATGVGIQVATPDGRPLTYNSLAPSGVTLSSTTEGNYAIPLQARYYQTSSVVRAGAANASMTFTLSYE